jgi:hypothetical protein
MKPRRLLDDHGDAGPYGYGCQCAKDVIFGAPKDDTPLGRAEWIKYISVFFNEEDRANLIFSREKNAYEATIKLAESAAATHKAANGGTKKKCAWISETDYDYQSGSYKSWKIDSDAYKLMYCTDAGMEAVAVKSDVTYAKGTDELKTALADVDVIIDQSFWKEKSYDTKAKVFTELGFAESDLKTGAILLRTDKEISADKNSAWLESGVLRPAHVLQDSWRLLRLLPRYHRDDHRGGQRQVPHRLRRVGIRQQGGSVRYQHHLRRRDGPHPRFTRGQAFVHHRHRHRPHRRRRRRVRRGVITPTP